MYIDIRVYVVYCFPGIHRFIFDGGSGIFEIIRKIP